MCSIWLRHDLASFKQRLAVLEKQVTEHGIVLTEAQVVALEKKQDDLDAWLTTTIASKSVRARCAADARPCET
jgi:hypothetical protein